MEKAHGTGILGIGAASSVPDTGRATTVWEVRKYGVVETTLAKTLSGLLVLTDSVFAALNIQPYEYNTIHGNLITNAGWTRLMNLLTNQGATQALDATHARIGVGNSNTAEAYTDTDLGASAGSANRWFQLVSGAGSLGTRTLSFSASFGSSDGNFAWNEFGIDFGTASGNTVTAPLFNHKAGIAQGTKASGQTWTATATITFS